LSRKRSPPPELENKIAAYEAAILAKEPAANIQPAARELHDLLIPPGLAAEKQLCLVPDKFSARACLCDARFEPGQISPAGLSSVLRAECFCAGAGLGTCAEQSASGDESVLSIGNPDFDREENRGLADLESAADESKSSCEQLSKSMEFTGAAATKEKFLKNLDSVDVVHFAGHYVANRQSPANSKLLFAGENCVPLN
jgi:hypothetical protein